MRHFSSLLLFCTLLTACESNTSVSVPELLFGGLNGNVTSTKEYHYSAIEKFGEVLPDELETVVVTGYDKEGHKTKCTYYNSEGDFIYGFEDFYENGLRVKTIEKHKYLGQTRESIVLERKKNYVKWRHIDGDQQFDTELIYAGLSFYCLTEKGDKVYETVFDKKGHSIDYKHYQEGKIDSRSQHEYDKSGNLVKTTIFHSSGDSDIYTYSYPDFDKRGNWITQYEYEKGEAVFVIRREISYR